MSLDNFYYDLEETRKETKQIVNSYGRKEYKKTKTQCNLNMVFDYYFHADTGVIVGLAEPLSDHNFKYYDFIDINTGLSLPRNGRCYYAVKQVLMGRAVNVGQYKPLNPQLLQWIRDRQQRIIRNKNKYHGDSYD